MNLMRRTALQLNRSLEPLRIISSRRALELVTRGKAVVVVTTDIQAYHGIYVPSVIRLVNYAKVPYKRPIPSRNNIFTRDQHRCMYCGSKGGKIVLELEHIIPKSRGGPSSWENMVCSCHACNQKKRDMTPEEAGMKLIHRPLPATVHTSRFVIQKLGSEIDSWGPYLWLDSKGEQSLVARG